MSVSPPRPRPSPPGESIGLSLTGGILTFVGVFTFLIWLEYGYTLLLAVPIACLVALLMLLGRIKQRDYQIYLAMFPPNEPEPEPEPVVRTQYVTTNKTSASSGVYNDHGLIDLPEHEWVKLAQFVTKKGGVSRDGLLKLGLSWKHGLKDTVKDVTGYDALVRRWGKGEFALLSGTSLTEYGRAYFDKILQDAGHSPTANQQYQTAHIT